jgi:hypothetical protein
MNIFISRQPRGLLILQCFFEKNDRYYFSSTNTFLVVNLDYILMDVILNIYHVPSIKINDRGKLFSIVAKMKKRNLEFVI